MSDQHEDQQQQSEQSQPESSEVGASGSNESGAGHEQAEIAAGHKYEHNSEKGDGDKEHTTSDDRGSDDTSECKSYFVKVEAQDAQEGSDESAGTDSKQELEHGHQQEANEGGESGLDVERTSEMIERSGDNTNTTDVTTGKQPMDKKSSVGTSTLPITETQEVSSTKNDDPPKSMRTSRRSSYQSSRGYAGGYQNYGLAYLPYKSNFEPSEDARRKADEFFKTLKL